MVVGMPYNMDGSESAMSEKAKVFAGVLAARSQIGIGDADAGCAAAKALQRDLGRVPKPLKPDLMLVGAWCTANGRNSAAAGLAADLLRAEQVNAPVPLAVLDALATGTSEQLKLPRAGKAALIDFRFLEIAQADHAPTLIANAEPALLTYLAKAAANPPTRILAAEAAVALHAITPQQLAEA